MKYYCINSLEINLLIFLLNISGIEAELNSSLQFEKNLEAMYMNESCEFEKNGENEQRETKDIIDEENMLEMSTSFHYPVISMVNIFEIKIISQIY